MPNNQSIAPIPQNPIIKNMKIPKRKTIILNEYIGFLMFIQIGGNVPGYETWDLTTEASSVGSLAR